MPECSAPIAGCRRPNAPAPRKTRLRRGALATVRSALSGDHRPSQGGRRARRGYRYQDLYALQCCLDMADCQWDEVIIEGEDDITCVRGGPPSERLQVQVKTREDPAQLWSAAQLCYPDKNGRPETSILGRLFNDKPLTDDTRFLLVLNEGIVPPLVPLRERDSERRRSAEDALIARLQNLTVPGAPDIDWCVGRLQLARQPVSLADLEDRNFRRLGFLCKTIGKQLLPDEVEQVLGAMMGLVEARGRSQQVRPITKAEVQEVLAAEADVAADRVGAALQGNQTPLIEKLAAVNIVGEEADRVLQLRHRFARSMRSAVGRELQEYRQLLDDIFSECHTLRVRANEGTIPRGAALHRQSIEAAKAVVHGFGSATVARPSQALGAMYEITGRCQHRFD